MIKTSCANDDLFYSLGTDYPPFTEQAIHSHDKCELYWLVKGNGYYVTEGSRHSFEPGKILLMRPGETHRAMPLDTSPYTRMSVHFFPSVVDRIDPSRHLLRTFYDRPLGLNNVYDKKSLAGTAVYENLEKLCRPCEDNAVYCTQVLTYLFPILLELGNVFDQRAAGQVPLEIPHQIVDYISRNLSEDLSVQQICDKFFLTRGQLHRCFKKTTGVNLWEYITLKRLVLARSHIQEGMPASEAAFLSGFRDYSAFYRAYMRKYGTPPSGKTNHR